MTSPRLYSVYGLTLASDFEFDMLEAAPDAGQAVDLRVIRTTGILRHESPPADRVVDLTPETQYMYWSVVGAFRITCPDLVEVEPYEGVSDYLVSQPFLGLVSALVLERQGLLCLHASAVSVAGRAAIFLGDKGAGKSTTNGALLARGHLALTDDLVAVETAPEGSVPKVRPGFSTIKLWPDSVAALQLAADDKDRLVHPSVTKLQKPMPAPVAPAPVPMGGLFVLRRSAEVATPETRRLPPHEALQMVMRYSFLARYGETRLGPAHLAAHLRRCGAVVAQVPVHELRIPADLARLPDLSEAIEVALARPA